MSKWAGWFFLFSILSYADVPSEKKYVVFNGQKLEIINIYRHRDGQNKIGIQVKSGNETKYFQFIGPSEQMATLFMNTILGDNSVDVITQSELLAINDEASHARQWRLAARSSETEHFPSGFFPASDQLSTSAYQEKIEDYISTIINQTQLLQARQKIEQLENRLNESDRRTAELENQLEQMQRRLDQIYSRLPQLGPSDGDRLTIESQKSLHSVEVHPSIPSARQQ